MDKKERIGQKLEQKLYLEVWWDMTWAKAFHFLPIKRYFGEELQKNCFGLSKAQLMQASYNKKASIYGQEIAQNNTWKVLVWIGKQEILVQFMAFSGDIGMLLILIETQITKEKV